MLRTNATLSLPSPLIITVVVVMESDVFTIFIVTSSVSCIACFAHSLVESLFLFISYVLCVLTDVIHANVVLVDVTVVTFLVPHSLNISAL